MEMGRQWAPSHCCEGSPIPSASQQNHPWSHGCCSPVTSSLASKCRLCSYSLGLFFFRKRNASHPVSHFPLQFFLMSYKVGSKSQYI